MLGCIQPISSPIINKMFGFDCCAAAGRLAVTTAAVASRARPVRCPKVMVVSSAGDASEPDMAHGRIDLLRMPGSWAVTAAIAGCAEVGPALDHLAGNFTARMAWVVAAIHYRPARVLRDAAGLLNLRRMLPGIPV